jgi:hypothetical protein
MNQTEEDRRVQMAALDLLAMVLAERADECQVRIRQIKPMTPADTSALAELFRIRLDWHQGNLTRLQAHVQIKNVLQRRLG